MAAKVKYASIPQETERWGKALLDCSFEVHTTLGAGFLERVYEDALCYELALRGVPFERQKSIIVPYKDFQIEGLRLDLLVGGSVIAEIKAVDAIHPIHQAQLMSYLKATGLRLGFVVNFNVPPSKARHLARCGLTLCVLHRAALLLCGGEGC